MRGVWGGICSTAAPGSGLDLGGPGCPQRSGLPFDCFMPNTALHGDLLLTSGGELGPFKHTGRGSS